MAPAARGSTAFLLILACGITALNAAKPLVVDDAAFHRYALQISEAPSDPYGFEIYWYDAPAPANRVLAPPVVPHWWAIAIAVFGDRPVLWKLWFFPFVLLLVLGVRELAERLAPRLGDVLVCVVVISPAILPAFNLMLDMPALALAAASLVLLLAAGERPRPWPWGLLAGLVGGLAMQTKYTAVLPFVAGLFALSIARQGRAVLAAGSMAALVFVGWEASLVARYGESHFLNAVALTGQFARPSLGQWLVAHGSLLGAGSVGAILVALRVCKLRRAALVTSGTWVVLAFAAIAALPADPLPVAIGSFERPAAARLETPILCALGALVVLAAALALWRGLACGLPEAARRVWADGAADREARLDLFVLAWVAIELGGLVLLSPFPALRRMIGLHLALSLALGRAASRVGVGPRQLLAASSVGLCVGVLFAVSDLSDARVRRDVAVRSSEAATEAVLRRRGSPQIQDPKLWYLGHWGFQFYAERQGLRPIVPGRSLLHPGDVIVVPEGVHRPRVELPADAIEPIDLVRARNPWPWSTLPAAYLGYPPIRRQADVQLYAVIYRVERSIEARLAPDAPAPQAFAPK